MMAGLSAIANQQLNASRDVQTPLAKRLGFSLIQPKETDDQKNNHEVGELRKSALQGQVEVALSNMATIATQNVQVRA